MNDPKPFDIQTAVKILAPKEMGITLVSLEAIEESDNAFLWGSIFLSFATCAIGAAISLHTSNYSHPPFVYLVGILSILFLVLSVIFFYRGSTLRKKARKDAVHEPISHGSPVHSEDNGSGKVQNLLKEHFDDSTVRTKSQIIGKIASFSAGDVSVNEIDELVDVLIQTHVFSQDSVNHGEPQYIFNQHNNT